MRTTPRRAQLGLLAAATVFGCSMSILSAGSLGKATATPTSRNKQIATAVEKDTRPQISSVLAMKRP